MTPSEQLAEIRDFVTELHQRASEFINGELRSDLQSEKIELVFWKHLDDVERDWAMDFFEREIFPVLTPMAVDQGHPFPLISNLSTSIAVSLQAPGEDELLFARIKVPTFFPSWIELPSEGDGPNRLLSMVDLIFRNLDSLFPRMTVVSKMAFRLVRNIDAATEDEEAEDLLETISEELKLRRFAEVVKLEYGPNPDPWILGFLMRELELQEDDVYEVGAKLEYRDMWSVYGVDRPQLKYDLWNPVVPSPLGDPEKNIFSLIKNGDILVHHPYESFSASVERFISKATVDPKVLAIKMTLYRTGDNSSIVKNLIRAAEQGKQVVCLVEIKARLDEERNIYAAQAMERAGVHVVYGIVGLKTHSKLALVVRREKDGVASYVHVGTGNYNASTAKLYTDLGLLTCDPDITKDVVEVFHYLTGRSLKSRYRKLMVAPVSLKSEFLRLIAKEELNAREGKSAGIFAKMNSLEDSDIIDALYKASQAGAEVRLIVRGFSCLNPGVKGLSENIQVISVIGQFLEHSRVFCFKNGRRSWEEGIVTIGSADWMKRNLNRRVEVVTPISEQSQKQRLIDFLEMLWMDRRLVWDMLPGGTYKQRDPKSEKSPGAHVQLMMQAQLRERHFREGDGRA